MKRAKSAVYRITQNEPSSTVSSHQSKVPVIPESPSGRSYSIFHRLLRRNKQLGAQTPAAKMLKQTSSVGFNFDSLPTSSPFLPGGKAKEIDLFQSSTQLTNQSLSNTQMLQRKLLFKETVAQLSLNILERLFNQRCKDMRIKFFREQFLRFLDKVHQQCQGGNLNLKGMALTQSCMELICELVADGDLSSINLAQNEIYDKGIILLSSKINSVELVSLDVSNCGIGPHGFLELFSALRNNNSIINLNIGNPASNNRNRLGQHGCEHLGQLISNNPYLQILGIQACGINNKMISALNHGFSSNSELKHICMAENELSGLSGESIHVVTSLDWLELQGNKMGDFGIVLIAEQLRPKANALEVRKLNLAENKLTLNGLQGIFEHLERNLYIQHLILDNNLLAGTQSALFFSAFLSGNTTLTHLSMKKCSMTLEMMEQIAYGLKRNNKLQSLILSKNPIGDAGAIALAESLQESTSSLQVLVMKRCGLNDVGAEPLFNSFYQQPKLQFLDFSSNLIGDEAALYAARALKVNKGIIQFKLRKNLISYNLQEELGRLIQFNLDLWQEKLIPDLRLQCQKISDYESQQKLLNEIHSKVTQKREKVTTDLTHVERELKKTSVQAVEKSQMVEDRLKKAKTDLQQIIKSAEQIEKQNWSEAQILDEQIKVLTNNIMKENQQVAQMTKQYQELQNKYKSLQQYFKEKMDTLKMHSDMISRKYKTAQAEFDGFEKQMDRMRVREEDMKRKTVILQKGVGRRESTQSPTKKKK